MTYESRILEFALFSLVFISVIDIIVAMSLYRAMTVTPFLRPFVLVVCIRSLREAWKRILWVVWLSKEILILFICYIIFFFWLAFRMFRGTVEGSARCPTMWECGWNILI